MRQSAYFWLPLRPASEQWDRKWASLMSDRWLEDKLSRRATINEHIQYLDRYVPEFFQQPPGLVIDIGPGAGALLEIARALGHEAIGVDAPPEQTAGMGDQYRRACRLMWARQELEVREIGGREFFGQSGESDVVLFNSRGSLEQTFSDFFSAPIVQRSKPHAWVVTPRMRDSLWEMASCFSRRLRPGGVAMIYANGARNSNMVDDMLDGMALEAGLVIEISEPRLHKWVKPCE